MNVWLLVALAAITYLSRASSLVWLGRTSGRVEEVLARMPAPIFAGLAVLSLVNDDGGVADLPILLAALGALVAGTRRSLAVSVLGGLVGYGVGMLLV